MNNRIIKILHIFHDDKFFDSVSDFFDNLSNISNTYIFYAPKDYKFNYIKHTNKISIIHSLNEYYSYFKRKDIDIIYFHSLGFNKYKLYKHIDNKKIVIWWAWGYDLYHNHDGIVPPLININQYKINTAKIIEKNNIKERSKGLICAVKGIKKTLLRAYISYLQKKMISRIDYFSPVLSTEYEFLLIKPFFKAKPFMLNSGPGLYNSKFNYRGSLGNILLGNSLTYTNNHFDILEILKSIKLDKNRKIIIPINYGSDYRGDKTKFIKEAKKFIDNGIYLENFLPKEEYNHLYDNVSHIIMGHIRQQAIGNIIMAIYRGVKIFLYKDSIAYRHYKKLGYVVYSIDDDLSEKALNEPLSYEEALHNFTLHINNENTKVTETEKALQQMFIKNGE